VAQLQRQHQELLAALRETRAQRNLATREKNAQKQQTRIAQAAPKLAVQDDIELF